MIYLPDTNVCVVYLRQRNPEIIERFEAHNPEDIALCDIVRAELYYGIYRSARPEHHLLALQTFLAPFPTLPFDSPAAEIFGRIRRELELVGTPIGPYDLQIAATALARNLILVTHNTREFSRVAGLQLEDWEI